LGIGNFVSPMDFLEKFGESHTTHIPWNMDNQDIVPLGFDVENRHPVFIDMGTTPRQVLICAPKDAGKSLLMIGLEGRLYERGFQVLCLHDLHSERRDIDKPNSKYEEMIEKEMDWAEEKDRYTFIPFEEVPFGWDDEKYVRYSPEWCSVPGTKQFSFNITELEPKLWRSFLKIGEGHKWRKWAFSILYDFITAKRKINPDFRFDATVFRSVMEDIEQMIETSPDSQWVMKSTSLDTIKTETATIYEDYFKSGMFEGEYVTDVFTMIYKNKKPIHIIVDWFGYSEGIDTKTFLDRDIYLTVLFTNFFQWAKANYNTKQDIATYISLDEVQNILTGHRSEGTLKAPPSLRLLRNLSAEGRKFGIGYMLAFQGEINKVDALIWQNCDLLIFHAGTTPQSFLRVLITHFELDIDIYTLIERQKEAPSHAFWVADKTDRSIRLVIAYPPLNEHYTGKRKHTKRMVI